MQNTKLLYMHPVNKQNTQKIKNVLLNIALKYKTCECVSVASYMVNSEKGRGGTNKLLSKHASPIDQ